MYVAVLITSGQLLKLVHITKLHIAVFIHLVFKPNKKPVLVWSNFALGFVPAASASPLASMSRIMLRTARAQAHNEKLVCWFAFVIGSIP